MINNLRNTKKIIKSDEGFTLIEILIAVFMVSILSVIVIQSVRMALNTSEVNKTKTIAIAIANEKIEKIRAMDYKDIGIIDGDPGGTIESEVVTDDGFTIKYKISWVDKDKSYKQVEVSVTKEPMNSTVEVITQISPLFTESGEEQ